MGRIWTKVGYRLQIGKESILANHTSLRGKQTPVATFIKDTNGVLLKHQKGILNCWIKYVYKLLNPVTVQHLKTSKEQICKKFHLTEVQVSTAIKSLKSGKAPDKNDIPFKMLKATNNFAVRVCQVAWRTGGIPKQPVS